MWNWFNCDCRSEAAAAELKPSGALAGKGRAWLVEPCTVSGSGQTSNCGGQLQALDLEEHEWEQFAEGIARLATKQERKPKDFEAFKVCARHHTLAVNCWLCSRVAPCSTAYHNQSMLASALGLASRHRRIANLCALLAQLASVRMHACVHCLLDLLVTISVQMPACVHVHCWLELLVTMSVQMPACMHACALLA